MTDVDVLRGVNRYIYEISRSFGGGTDVVCELVCECGHATCGVTMLRIDRHDAADLLAAPGTLLVAPGHEPPETTLLGQTHDYRVLRKLV